MIKNLTKIAINAAFAVLALVLFAGLLTPEKTRFGTYTDPILYWTNDTYFANNFTNAADNPDQKIGCETDYECEQIYGADYTGEEDF